MHRDRRILFSDDKGRLNRARSYHYPYASHRHHFNDRDHHHNFQRPLSPCEYNRDDLYNHHDVEPGGNFVSPNPPFPQQPDAKRPPFKARALSSKRPQQPSRSWIHSQPSIPPVGQTTWSPRSKIPNTPSTTSGPASSAITSITASRSSPMPPPPTLAASKASAASTPTTEAARLIWPAPANASFSPLTVPTTATPPRRFFLIHTVAAARRGSTPCRAAIAGKPFLNDHVNSPNRQTAGERGYRQAMGEMIEPPFFFFFFFTLVGSFYVEDGNGMELN